MTRTFEDKPAKRERVPLLVGLVGPSSSGKTKSALRLAEGMQRVTGGEVYYIDTEANRALHYAEEHTFRHLAMDAPFSPLDYLEAIRHCVSKGAKIIVVDSASHEHEGPGGVLDMHDTELDRMAGDDENKRRRMTFSAWAKPKAQRRKLIDEILRMGVNAIFCFRAKEKLKVIPGKPPLALGWQPIAGDEFIYEMTASCLLYPAADGVPNWDPDEKGERVMIKRPKYLADILKDGQQLSEDMGEAMALWAQGEVKEAGNLDEAVTEFQEALSLKAVDAARAKWGKFSWSDSDKKILGECVSEVKKSLTPDEGAA